MKWIDITQQLPPEGVYVLVRHNKNNWCDSTDQEGVQFDVAKMQKITGFKCANNLTDYEFTTFGPQNYWGQEITHWLPIPRTTSLNKPQKHHKDKTWIELRSEAVMIQQPNLTPAEAFQEGFKEAKRMASDLITERPFNNPNAGVLIRAIGQMRPHEHGLMD